MISLASSFHKPMSSFKPTVIHKEQQLKCSMMIMGRIHRIVNAPLAHDYSSLYDFQNVMF